MSPNDWTSLSDWIVNFRALHDDARRGKLDAQAMARYAQDREVLAKALLIAQRLSVKPGSNPRQTLRVAAQLPVELVGPDRKEKATTLDLGLGGFAALLPKPLSLLERLGFVLTLTNAGGSVQGRARVVNVQRKGKPYRVAFAFEELQPGDIDRVGLEVFDHALTTIPPR